MKYKSLESSNLKDTINAIQMGAQKNPNRSSQQIKNDKRCQMTLVCREALEEKW